MSDLFKPTLTDSPGICIFTFSLEGEINPNLRNKLRRIIDTYDLFVAGTTLFEGVITLDNLEKLIADFMTIVDADQTGAALTNLEVWFMGTQRFSHKLTRQAA